MPGVMGRRLPVSITYDYSPSLSFLNKCHVRNAASEIFTFLFLGKRNKPRKPGLR